MTDNISTAEHRQNLVSWKRLAAINSAVAPVEAVHEASHRGNREVAVPAFPSGELWRSSPVLPSRPSAYAGLFGYWSLGKWYLASPIAVPQFPDELAYIPANHMVG